MNHLDDDALVLVHYGEAAPEAADHALACAECQGRLSVLSDLLGAVQPPPTPERPADYGARVWARLEPLLGSRALPEEAPNKLEPTPAPALPFRAVGRKPWRRVGGLLAVAAALVMAFLLGQQFPGPAAQALSPAVRERILLVAIGDHLERSQMVLLEIANAPAEGSLDVSAERASAHDLVFANRLYRQTASRAGESALAAMLEELERVLVEVSAGPERLAPGDLAELQRRIESRELLFKIRVVGSQVREREKARTPSAARAS